MITIVSSCFTDHLTFKLGCTRVHAQSPTGLALHQTWDSTADIWLETDTLPLHLWTQPVTGTWFRSWFCLLLLCDRPLFVWLHWLRGSPKTNPTLWKYTNMCEWLLLGTIPCSWQCRYSRGKEARGHVQGVIQKQRSCSDAEQEQTLKRRPER